LIVIYDRLNVAMNVNIFQIFGSYHILFYARIRVCINRTRFRSHTGA
jgi:hypothetical protein